MVEVKRIANESTGYRAEETLQLCEVIEAKVQRQAEKARKEAEQFFNIRSILADNYL